MPDELPPSPSPSNTWAEIKDMLKIFFAGLTAIALNGGLIAIWNGGAVNVKPKEPVPVVQTNPVEIKPVTPAVQVPPAPASVDDIKKLLDPFQARLDAIEKALPPAKK